MRPILGAALIVTSISILIATCTFPSFASQVVSLNIADLTKAEVVFTGTCAGANTHLMSHPRSKKGLLVTTYTFMVAPEGVIKGIVPKVFAFTQWGAGRGEARRLGAPYVVGLPHYDIGKEYTLFLTSESELGLRAPLGLGTGKFDVVVSADGKRKVVNELGNKGLFVNLPATPGVVKAMKAHGISPARPPEGAVDYDSFVGIIKSLGQGV